MFSHEQLAEEIKEKEQEINKKLDKIVTELTQVALPNLELARELDDFIQAVQDNKFDYSLIEKSFERFVMVFPKRTSSTCWIKSLNC